MADYESVKNKVERKLRLQLTEDRRCPPCKNGTQAVRTENSWSAGDFLEHCDHHPIPKPDFCHGVTKTPLSSSTAEARPGVCQNLGARLTANPANNATDGQNDHLPKKLNLHLDDLFNSRSPNKPVTSARVDVDSVVSYGFPLSLLNTTLNINLVPPRAPILSSNQHFYFPGHKTPLHKTPHFRFGTFGEKVPFDLFMFLPNCKDQVKSTYVPYEFLKAWVNEVVIPASKEAIPWQNRSQFSSNWDQELAKAGASREGKRTSRGKRKVALDDDEEDEEDDVLWDPKLMNLTHPVDRKYIKPFWDGIRRRLDAFIANDHPQLKYFKGYQFVCSGKNWKTRVSSPDLPELMDRIREEVCTSDRLIF